MIFSSIQEVYTKQFTLPQSFSETERPCLCTFQIQNCNKLFFKNQSIQTPYYLLYNIPI